MKRLWKKAPRVKIIFLAYLISIAIISILSSGIAFATEEGHPQASIGSLFWPFVNFIIFVGILFYFLSKPAREFLLNRRDSVKSAIEEATKAKEVAEAKYREYEKKLEQSVQEIESILATLTKEGELEKKRDIEDAEKRAERMKEQVKMAVDRELEKAKIVLREEAAELALETAEKFLIDNITAADQERLTKNYIDKMGELH